MNKPLSRLFGAILAVSMLFTMTIPAAAATINIVPLLETQLKVTPLINAIEVTGIADVIGISKTQSHFEETNSLVYSLDEKSFVVYAKLSNGNITQGFDLTPMLPKRTETTPLASEQWTNKDVLMIGSGSKSPYKIDHYEYQINNGSWRFAAPNGAFFMTMEGMWDVNVTAIGNDMTRSGASATRAYIDKTIPMVSFTLDEDSINGIATVFITATDALSGIDYIQLPDGTKVQSGSYKWSTRENGYYNFAVVDKAGNSVTKTFDLREFRSDYYISDFHTTSKPTVGENIEVDVVFGSRSGSGVNIPIHIKDSTTGEIYTQETISISKGTTLKKHYSINVPDVAVVKGLSVTINPSGSAAELDAADNVKTITFDAVKYDFSVDSVKVNNINVTPKMEFDAVANISGSGLTNSRRVLVEFCTNNVVVDTQYVDLGGSANMKRVTGRVAAPDMEGPFEIEVRVNKPDMDKEVDNLNNKKKITMQASKQNLGLKINTLPVIDGLTYGFAYAEAEGKFCLATEVPTETIQHIVFEGKKINVAAPTYDLVVKGIQVGDSIPLRILVESAGGFDTKEYNIKLTRYNGEVGLRVTYSQGTFTNEITLDPTNKEPVLRVPVKATSADVKLETVDTGAKITMIGTDKNTNAIQNKFETLVSMPATGGEKLLSITVTSEDGKTSQEYAIKFNNSNMPPKVTLVNRAEIEGVEYGPRGFIPNGKTFMKYGESMTKVMQAKRDGINDGIILQIEVVDDNIDQELQGAIDLGGVKYPITWNSFTGSTVGKTATTKYGYAHVSITDTTPNIAISDKSLKISVSDYTIGGTESLSTTEASAGVTIDTTPPSIMTTIGEEQSDGKKKGSIPVEVQINGGTDVSLYTTSFAVSKDSGKTWTAETKMDNSSISIEGSGQLMLRITAVDKLYNVGTKIDTLIYKAGSTSETDANVFVRKTRIADYYFIGTNKESDGTLNPSNFDFDAAAATP